MNPFGHWPILSTLVYLPLVGGLLLLTLPNDKLGDVRAFALGVTLVDLVLSLVLFFAFQPGTAAPQFVERCRWVPTLGISYHMGIDGVSLLMVCLTTLLSAIAVLCSWTSVQDRVKAYMAFLLFLEAGMLGVFVSLDIFLFYVFWEAMLVPMYFLIGVWGGSRRIYAAVKFFVYTMVGSLLMLVAILALYFLHHRATGSYSTDLADLIQTPLAYHTQKWLFFAFFLAFAIKVPMFPFHTWLPDAHTEAPTAGSLILAGVLLKMGTYGFFRFALPLFPDAARGAAPAVIVLAIIGIIYGALVALPQRDWKKLVAYSSVSHLGFAVLGLFAFNVNGVNGSVLYWINHGLSTGALFLLVGIVYERRHTRQIEDFGGLWLVMPAYAVFFLIAMLSSIGLPGLNGFVGEFLTVLGAYGVNPTWGYWAAVGIVLGAVYMLWLYQRVMTGEITHEENRSLKDLNVREWAYLVPLVLLMFWIGLYPKYLLDRIQPSTAALVATMHTSHLPSAMTAEIPR